jgi:hypothetical protein
MQEEEEEGVRDISPLIQMLVSLFFTIRSHCGGEGGRPVGPFTAAAWPRSVSRGPPPPGGRTCLLTSSLDNNGTGLAPHMARDGEVGRWEGEGGMGKWGGEGGMGEGTLYEGKRMLANSFFRKLYRYRWKIFAMSQVTYINFILTTSRYPFILLIRGRALLDIST